jgi:hypothetical protein
MHAELRYEEPVGDLERLLILSCRGGRSDAERDDLAKLHRRLGDAACEAAARKNQVLALVADALVDCVDPRDLSPNWQRILGENEARVGRLIGALKDVLGRFGAPLGRVAVVENAGVLLDSDLPLRAFCAGDFDLLVAQRDWEALRVSLEAEGFRPADRRARPTNRLEYRRETATEVQWLDVGYASFDRMWVPLEIADRSAHWVSRGIASRKVRDIPVLAPADALAFVSMHTSLHSYVRQPGVRLHVDVDRLVRAGSVDWEAYLEEVKSLGAPTRAFVSLAMAAGLMGTPVPERVLRALYPGPERWRKIRSLLTNEGVFENGRPKLGRTRSLALDRLLSERPMAEWFYTMLVPSPAWLREHFDREGAFRGPPWLLHGRRAWMMARRWLPR